MFEKKDRQLIIMVFAVVPSALALLGAFTYLPSWYYSFFKVVMVIDSVISIAIYSANKENNNALAFPTCIICFIAFLGLLTAFVIDGGFPKSAWVILDLVYAISKGVQYFIISGNFK